MAMARTTKIRAAQGLCVLLALGAASAARAQAREPLCTVVETRRVLAGTSIGGEGDGERIVAEPLLAAGASNARFVVATRDPLHALAAGGAHPPARDLSELGYAAGVTGTPPHASGLSVVRTDERMIPVGEAVFVPDPGAGAGTVAPALPLGVALPAGVLVLQRLGGDLYAVLVPPAGEIPAARRVLEAPSGAGAAGARGFAWFTATARDEGAVALAGTADGAVVAVRFDRDGAVAGAPVAWSQRVGGAMQLLPTGAGAPLAALLARPVQGTGPQNEQAAQQVVVHLTDALQPAAGPPAATGFAQYPMAYVRRGDNLVLVQWAQAQGLAIAVLPVTAQRLGQQLPRLWYAQPPLDGAHVGQAALLGSGNIVYDLAVYTDPLGGALYGHLAWIPPSAVPIVRRDVLPVRTRLVAPPRVLPAADGVVAVLAGVDETGAAVDAFHVRCDLVSVPAQGGQ
jgi:hypothetical protein